MYWMINVCVEFEYEVLKVIFDRKITSTNIIHHFINILKSYRSMRQKWRFSLSYIILSIPRVYAKISFSMQTFKDVYIFCRGLLTTQFLNTILRCWNFLIRNPLWAHSMLPTHNTFDWVFCHVFFTRTNWRFSTINIQRKKIKMT